jgi:hypothetical protein
MVGRARQHLLGCSLRPSLRAPGFLLPENPCAGGFAPDECPTLPGKGHFGSGPSCRPREWPLQQPAAGRSGHLRPEMRERGHFGASAWAQAVAPIACRSDPIPRIHPITRFEFAMLRDASVSKREDPTHSVRRSQAAHPIEWRSSLISRLHPTIRFEASKGGDAQAADHPTPPEVGHAGAGLVRHRAGGVRPCSIRARADPAGPCGASRSAAAERCQNGDRQRTGSQAWLEAGGEPPLGVSVRGPEASMIVP